MKDSALKTTFKHNLDVFPGNSGSPIFNDQNEVVGIHYKGPIPEWVLGDDGLVRPKVFQGNDLTRISGAQKVSMVQTVLAPPQNIRVRLVFADENWAGTSDGIAVSVNNQNPNDFQAGPWDAGVSYPVTPDMGGLTSAAYIVAVKVKKQAHPNPAFTDNCKISQVVLVVGNVVVKTWTIDRWLGDDEQATLLFDGRWQP